MKQINKKHIVALSILIVFGIVAFTIWNTVQGKNRERVFIENKTRSLAVESVTEPDGISNKGTVEISLKNNYDRSIAAYRVRVIEEFNGQNEESAVERGGVIAGWVLKPGEIMVEKFAVNSKKSKTYLTIAAVIFEDGTGDGETKELIRLQDIRAGVRMGFQVISPMIQEVVKTSDTLSSEAIQSLEGRIKGLSDVDIPDDSKRGFALAQSYITLKLRDIKDKKNNNPNFNSNAEVANKLTEIESALNKLSVNLPTVSSNERRQDEK